MEETKREDRTVLIREAASPTFGKKDREIKDGREGGEGDQYRTVMNSLHRPAARGRQRGLLIGVWDKTDHSNMCEGDMSPKHKRKENIRIQHRKHEWA